MIRHVVMWKLKDRAGGCDKAENIRRMKRELESLAQTVPVVLRLEVGIQGWSAKDAWDVVLIADFASRRDLDVYQDHPEHVRVRSWIQTIREEKQCVDFTVDPPGHG